MKNTNRLFLLLIVAVSIIIFIYAFTGSSQQRDLYQEEIRAEREAKDRLFRSKTNSPLTAKKRSQFTGLAYFRIDPEFKVKARLEKLNDDSIYIFRTSKKTVRRMKKYGKLHFKLANKDLELLALRGLDPLSRKMLFIPFTDKTSGMDTYGAGRYLDVSIPQTNTLILDFNQAYQPYCTYNANYECPLPPSENHLELRIEAGEKLLP